MGGVAGWVVSEIRVEVFEEAHVPGLLRLHREVFRSSLRPQQLQAKYRCRWAGREHPSHVALLGNEVVGFYGALPQRFRRGHETLVAIQVADLVVAPDLQRRGVHHLLHEVTLRHADSNKAPFLYGFCNAASQRLYQTLGWRCHQLELFVVPVATVPIAALAARMGILLRVWQAAFRRACEPLLGSREAFCSSYAGTNLMHVDYAADYLDYRCFSPNFVLDLGHATAWVRGGKELWVGDLSAANDNSHDRAVTNLIGLARRIGCRSLVFQTSSASTLARRLRRRFPARQGFPVLSLALTNNVDLDAWGCHFGDLDTF